ALGCVSPGRDAVALQPTLSTPRHPERRPIPRRGRGRLACPRGELAKPKERIPRIFSLTIRRKAFSPAHQRAPSPIPSNSQDTAVTSNVTCTQNFAASVQV